MRRGLYREFSGGGGGDSTGSSVKGGGTLQGVQ